jgi:hypothetical protein
MFSKLATFMNGSVSMADMRQKINLSLVCGGRQSLAPRLVLLGYIQSGWKEDNASENDHWISLLAFVGVRAIRLDRKGNSSAFLVLGQFPVKATLRELIGSVNTAAPHCVRWLTSVMVHDTNRFMNITRVSRQLRSVASSSLSLRGLHQVAVGVMMLFMIPALGLDSPWNIWLLLVLFVLLGVSCWRIRFYYERRFGYVEPRTRPWYWGCGQHPTRQMLFWIAVILLTVAAAKVFRVSIFTPGWLLGIVFGGFFALEKKPWYYLLFAVTFFVLAVLNRTPHHNLLLIEIWLLPFALIFTGILDHLLLVRLLSGVQPNGTT